MVLLHGHGARDAGIIRARVLARSETTLPRRRRAPMARAMRSPAGARRSTVMVAATTAIARRSMTPMTRRIAIRPAQQWLQWSPRRRPCRPRCPCRPATYGRGRVPPGSGQVTRLPRAELERVGDEDDHADRDRNGARQRRLLHLDRRQRDAQRKGGHSEHGPHEEVTHAHPFGTPGCAFRAAFLPGVKQAGRARFPNRKPLIGSKTCGMPPQPTYLTNMDFSSVVAGRLSFSRSRKEPDCFDVCPAFLFEFERSFANFIAVCDAITWPDCGAVLRARVADRSLGFGRQEDVSLPHRFPRLVVRLLLRHLSLLHQLPP